LVNGDDDPYIDDVGDPLAYGDDDPVGATVDNERARLVGDVPPTGVPERAPRCPICC
jgi:hypothetical protein